MTDTIRLIGTAWPEQTDSPQWPTRGDVVEADWIGEMDCWVFRYGEPEIEFFANRTGTVTAFLAEIVQEEAND